ncbi:MAG: CapA family protein [Planctomycetes bacterium]|nr:CapA family protein [Planctomycetota bacterium]
MAIDWNNGTWTADGAAGAPEARIMVTADWAPLRQYEELIPSRPEAVYGDLLPEIRAADLAVTNVECVLGDEGRAIPKAGPNLRAGAAAVAGLTAARFTVATLANNHVLDFGGEGLAATLDTLRGAGLRTVGAGMTEAAATVPLVVDVAGTSVGLASFCEGEDETDARGERPGTCGWDLGRAEATVRRLRGEVDVVLVVCHAGREHTPCPPPYIVAAYRRMAAAGADAVIAHHPHAPQGVEVRDGTPIVYSMGNFVFYQRPDLFFRHSGYMVELSLRGRRLAGLRLVPYVIGDEGLRLMTGRLRSWFFDRLREASEPLADEAALAEAWDAFIDLRQEAGFPDELNWALGAWKDDPALGAARVRNLFITPAHVTLWTRGLSRIVNGRADSAPEWARKLVRLWTTLPIAEGLTAR